MARHAKTKSSKRAAITVQSQPATKTVDTAEVRRLVNARPIGTKLRFTYKRQYPEVVAYLGGLIGAGVVTVDSPMVELLIHAIATSGNWERDQNRTFEVRIAAKFDVDWFVGRVGNEVESFEVVS